MERSKCFDLKKQNEQLRIKQREDRRKLLELQSQTKSIEQIIKFSHGQQPQKLQNFASVSQSNKNALKSSIAIPKSKQQNLSAKKKFIHEHTLARKQMINAKQNAAVAGGKILRTIQLPNQNIERLDNQVEETIHRMNQKVSASNQAMNVQQNQYKQILFRLRQKRSEKQEQLRQRFLTHDKNLCNIVSKLQNCQQMTFETARDQLQFTQLHYAETRKLQEENQALRQKNAQIHKDINQIHADKDKDIKKTKKLTLEQSGANAMIFKRQVQAEDQHLEIIKQQYQKIEEIQTRKVKSLRDAIQNTQKKHKTLQTRRNLEIEGFTNDINQMNSKLNIFQQYITKLRTLLQDSDVSQSQMQNGEDDQEMDGDQVPVRDIPARNFERRNQQENMQPIRQQLREGQALI